MIRTFPRNAWFSSGISLFMSNLPSTSAINIFNNSRNDHHHHHQNNGSAPKETASANISYFFYNEHKVLIYLHIALMILAWGFCSTAIVLSSTRPGRSVTIHLFAVTNVVGLALGYIYNLYTPDLYPNDTHRSMGWIFVVVAFIYFLAHFTKRNHQSRRTNYLGNPEEARSIFARLRAHSGAGQTSSQQTRLTNPEFERQSVSATSTVENESTSRSSISFEDGRNEIPGFSDSVKPGVLGTILPLVQRIGLWLGQAQNALSYVMLPTGFVAILTGAATYGRLFEGHAVYGGLAHWIKGSVFFWLGLFSLARWAGCFVDLGWAWNKPTRETSSRWRPSMEFIEAFLIFLYGSTNIFLEHIGGWGKAWTPKDFEHVSITILFIGTGLCGILIESPWLRALLDKAMFSSFEDVHTNEGGIGRLSHPTPGTSFNPMPAVTVLILGTMMGSHHQSSITSAMVHMQWGNLLASASVVRCLTYLMLFLKRSDSPYPSRPPTELIVSFCLISGGLTFMASAGDVVQSMEAHNLDHMFLINLIYGLTGVIMAWELIVLALRARSARRNVYGPLLG